MKILNLLGLVLLSVVLTLTSCDKDDDDKTAINSGAKVTVTNTIQSQALTGGTEAPIEAAFMVDEGSLAATNTVTDAVEFPAYLLGLYNIDISENAIDFELVAPQDDPTYSGFFRTIEAGTYDRYYLTFEEAQNVTGFTSTNSSVNLRIDSDKVLVVEIGEGYDFNPGTTFTINLKH